MTTIKPLINGSNECSAWDAFDMPMGFNGMGEVTGILRENFSLNAKQSDLTVYICVNKLYIMEIAKKHTGECSHVSISRTQLSVSGVTDLAGMLVFPGESGLFGWLIFIDRNIFANWGHECEYIFFVSHNKRFSALKEMPPMNIQMEDIR